MAEQFANNASTQLASGCIIGDTAIIVSNPAPFPTIGDFRLLVDNELMLCTGVTVDVFSVTRAIEGTTEADHALDATVTSPLTAGSLATIGGGGGAPSGPAGGVLDGTYPNPGIDASVAGAGLAETTNVLSVNVDNSSIEISSDTLQVKALGVTNGMLAGSIADAKLAVSYLKQDGSRVVTGNLDIGGFRITDMGDPTSLQDAVTVAELNNDAVGLMNTTVVCATTVALPACTYSNGSSGVGATLTANANGFLTVDGISTFVRDRILVKDQASALQNGIYKVTQRGDAGTPFILQRSQDMCYTNEFSHRLAFIVFGTTNIGKSFVCTTDTPVIGTDAVTFTDYAVAATVTQLGAIEATFDGGGLPILSPAYGNFRVPFSCTVTCASIVVDVAATITIDVRVCSYANYLATPTRPNSGDSIAAADVPGIVAARASNDTALTGWSLSLTQGQIIQFYLSANDFATKAQICLFVTKS